MVVDKAFGLMIHPCGLNDILITPKGPWIHPPEYRRLAHEILLPSALGLLAGPTSVLSIGFNVDFPVGYPSSHPLVLPISDRFHHG